MYRFNRASTVLRLMENQTSFSMMLGVDIYSAKVVGFLFRIQ